METPKNTPSSSFNEREKYNAEQSRKFDEFKKRESEYRSKIDECPDLVKMLDKIEAGSKEYVIKNIVESIGQNPYKYSGVLNLSLEELGYFKPEIVQGKLTEFKEIAKQIDPKDLMEFLESLSELGFLQSGEGSSGEWGGEPEEYEIQVRLDIMRGIDELISKYQRK